MRSMKDITNLIETMYQDLSLYQNPRATPYSGYSSPQAISIMKEAGKKEDLSLGGGAIMKSGYIPSPPITKRW